MKSITASVFKNMFKAAMAMVLVIAAIQVGGMWEKFQDEFPDATIRDFVSYQEQATINPAYETLPDKFIEKADDVNKLTRTVWFGILFFGLFEYFSFQENKNQHWAFQLHMMLKKRMEKSEGK